MIIDAKNYQFVPSQLIITTLVKHCTSSRFDFFLSASIEGSGGNCLCDWGHLQYWADMNIQISVQTNNLDQSAFR